jgi:hypothetical protein
MLNAQFISDTDFHITKGSRKNNLADFALRFGLDLVDPIEQSHRNSRLFRGFCE